jgi:nucleotide-binding universal stress UspA family protein
VKEPKRILVATDFSAGAARAVARAARIAAESGARLDILHASGSLSRRMLSSLGLGRSVAQEHEAQVARGMEAAAELARGHGAEPHLHTRKESPVAAIEAFLDRAAVDLLVLGARGERDLRQVVIGSTAERLVERGLCTTLVVRRPARAPYRNVLAGVASGSAAAGVIERAAALGPDAFVHVLHAYEPPFEAKLRSYGVDEGALRQHRQDAKRRAQQALGELVRSSDVPSAQLDVVLRRGHPVKVIVRTAERLNCDIIVMGRKEATVDAYLLGSVTKQVMRTTTLDVLVVAGD